ncbi:MAG: hypothetical protein J2P48_16500 [Alphaproteobacteria bacterium]|nr:hypothetical protein [Alphaproteobacteria bacterium]
MVGGVRLAGANPRRGARRGGQIKAFVDPKHAAADADVAYGTVPPELLARATKLRWICAARAGLGGAWFYEALVKSDVIVTNMRGKRGRVPARLRLPL